MVTGYMKECEDRKELSVGDLILLKDLLD